METFPEDPFEAVKAKIVRGDARQLVGISGEGAGGLQ